MPLVEELRPAPAAEDVFLRLCRAPHCLFLDSALLDPVLGRYSFVTADPFEFIELPPQGNDAFAQLAQRMQTFRSSVLPELPPLRTCQRA